MNEEFADDARGEEEGEQQTHDLVRQARHELGNGQPRRGVCGVERAGGDATLAHLQLGETNERINIGIHEMEKCSIKMTGTDYIAEGWQFSGDHRQR